MSLRPWRPKSRHAPRRRARTSARLPALTKGEPAYVVSAETDESPKLASERRRSCLSAIAFATKSLKNEFGLPGPYVAGSCARAATRSRASCMSRSPRSSNASLPHVFFRERASLPPRDNRRMGFGALLEGVLHREACCFTDDVDNDP